LKENTKLVLSVISIVVIGPILWWSWTSDDLNPPRPEISAEERDAGSLRYACKDRIEAVLHDPSSAQWGMFDDGWFQRWPVQDDGRTLIVTAVFRANNALGNPVLGGYRCTAERNGDSLTFSGIEEITP